MIPPVTLGADHAYKVPLGTICEGGLLFGETEKGEPLQIGILTLLITGIGLMVTVTLNGAPMHP